MITDGIVQLLLADPTLSGMTSCIVPVGKVKGVKSPGIVYHIGTTLDTKDAQGSTGYRLARFQFDSYSSLSYTEAKALARAVRGVLENFRGETLSDPDSTFVQGCLVDFETDMPFVPEGLVTIEYRVMVQVSVWYKES